jgi:hypothetical protein
MPGFEHMRFASFVFPFWVAWPTDRFELNRTINAWVPIDDEHTMIFNIDLQRAGGSVKSMRYADGTVIPGTTRPLEYLPRTNDWMGRWRSVYNRGNDHGIDREKQRSGESFSGIVGIPLQDQALQENMGPIVDRSFETLAASDRMVVLTRRALLQAATAYQESGTLPPVLDNPSLCRAARGGDLVAPAGTSWLDAYDTALAKLNPNATVRAAE